MLLLLLSSLRDNTRTLLIYNHKNPQFYIPVRGTTTTTNNNNTNIKDGHRDEPFVLLRDDSVDDVVVSVIIGIAIVRRRRLGSRKSIRATGQIGALLETGREQRSLSTTTGKKRNER